MIGNLFGKKDSTDHVQELVNKLMAEANLTQEQAEQSLKTIASFVKAKFPMIGGAVDNIFGKPKS